MIMSGKTLPTQATTNRRVRRLKLANKVDNIEGFFPEMNEDPISWSSQEVVVEVAAAAVNRSDVAAMLGMMPHAKWPRTPGRDFSGTVVEGPELLLGLEVWGSSGELGITKNGSHATHLVVHSSDVCAKPKGMSFLEAGSAGVPFVTAWKGFQRSGLPSAGKTVVVLGATGKVGQAAIQIATMQGARVIGVVREGAHFNGHQNGSLHIVSGKDADVSAQIRDLTAGHGADIVYNTIGSPYFNIGCNVLATRGCQIFIATIERAVAFDILTFYRGQHTFVGIDTLSLSTAETSAILAVLTPDFERGLLKPFPVDPSTVYALADAKEAYKKVWSWSRERVVITPQAASSKQ